MKSSNNISSIVAALLVVNILLPSVPSMVNAQSTSQNCEKILTRNQNRLEQGRNLQVKIERNNLSQQYPDHPEGRPHEYVFILKGSAANSVMASPKLVTAIAQEVIQHCNSAAMVSFGIANTSTVDSFAVFPDGRVAVVQCLEPGRPPNPPLQWGQKYCL